MEHRCSPRLPLNVPVLLEAPGGAPALNGRIANIGPDGAYVRALGLAFPRNALVDLVVPAAPGGRPGHLDAMVVHVGPGGAGLLFLEPDDELLARIMRLARGRVPAAPDRAVRPAARRH